jgi:hypothetical protein
MALLLCGRLPNLRPGLAAAVGHPARPDSRRIDHIVHADCGKTARDALAEELREVYPEPARKIADLFVRIAANNKALDELNRFAGRTRRLLSRRANVKDRGADPS